MINAARRSRPQSGITTTHAKKGESALYQV